MNDRDIVFFLPEFGTTGVALPYLLHTVHSPELNASYISFKIFNSYWASFCFPAEISWVSAGIESKLLPSMNVHQSIVFIYGLSTCSCIVSTTF
jgi:hypothetical protein